jgi:hypothetical protein
MSAHPIEVRVAHLEGAYEQISDRLNGFDLRFAHLEEKLDRGFQSVNDRMDREATNVRTEQNELRKLLVTGYVSIAGFILASIVISFVTHPH